MFTKDVLITDYVHPILIHGLHDQGFSTTYAPEMTRAEMEEHLPSYKGVVVNTRCALNAEAISSASRLEWIARLGSGLDIIDLHAASKAGVKVLSAPEGNAEAVAEHAMGMLLALSNKIISAHQKVCEGEWPREAHRGWEIAGKTIGIIGYGNNGSAFGRLWQGWDVRVLAYDKYLKAYAPSHVQETNLETLMAESDIISLHIPLTNETKEMVNTAFIKNCKPGFVLINTSRGKNVNLGDVLTALQSGHIGGACLDVFPVEPPTAGPDDLRESFEELCKLNNVVLTPHVAGWTVESRLKIAEVLLQKIRAIGVPR